MGLLGLFDRKIKLQELEKESIVLNKDIFDLIVKTERTLEELRKALAEDKTVFKDAKIAELENNLLLMKSKIESMKMDVQRIMTIEMENKDFILLNDDFYVQDKLNRIEMMGAVIEELLDLISERPALNELKDLITYIYSKMNVLVDSINNIISDDKHLDMVYSKISAL